MGDTGSEGGGEWGLMGVKESGVRGSGVKEGGANG